MKKLYELVVGYYRDEAILELDEAEADLVLRVARAFNGSEPGNKVALLHELVPGESPEPFEVFHEREGVKYVRGKELAVITQPQAGRDDSGRYL